jgi:hypothetical protein
MDTLEATTALVRGLGTTEGLGRAGIRLLLNTGVVRVKPGREPEGMDTTQIIKVTTVLLLQGWGKLKQND